jgi:hypothetical protein
MTKTLGSGRRVSTTTTEAWKCCAADSGSSERPARQADYLALVYHEARNVRHLIRAGAVDPEPYQFIVSLPTGRDEAWKHLQHDFIRRFHLGLEDLRDLYSNQSWKDYLPGCGGTAWRVIVEHVIYLRDALDRGDTDRADEALGRIPQLGHNTVQVAGVSKKLALLDATLDL